MTSIIRIPISAMLIGMEAWCCGWKWRKFLWRLASLCRYACGFVDGPNLYTYVKQNPWTHFDALGLYITYRKGDFKNKAQEKRFWDKYRKDFARTYKTPTGKELINQAQSSDKEIQVGPPQANSTIGSRAGLTTTENTAKAIGDQTKFELSKVNVELNTDDRADVRWTGLAHEMRHALDYINKTGTSTEGIGGHPKDANVPNVKDKTENRGTRTENVIAKEYNDITKKEMSDAWSKRDSDPGAKARYPELKSESELYRGPIKVNSNFETHRAQNGSTTVINHYLPEYQAP